MSSQLVTVEEANLILNSTRNELEALYILLLWHTGGRSTEVAHIKPEDINIKDGYIVLINLKQTKTYKGQEVKTKRSPFKQVYVNPNIINTLVKYIDENDIKPDSYIFSYNNSQVPWTNWNCWYITTRASRKAGVFKLNRYGKIVPAWTHTFRHGSATRQLEVSENNLVYVQEQLGHSNINTTRGYITISEKKKQTYSKGM